MNLLHLSGITPDFMRIAILLAVLMIGIIFSRIYKHRLGPALERLLQRTKHRADSILARGFSMPFTVFIWLSSMFIALWLLPGALGLSFGVAYGASLLKLWRIAVIVLMVCGFVASSDIASVFLQSLQNKLDIETSATVSRFLGYIFKSIVLAIGVVIVLSELNFDINGLIAGLGLGGLTIALAAKDTAGNFFGGLIIILEKPFEIGDWISAGAHEGVVEDITFRSTKLRTFQNALTIIPNSMLSAEAITNWTRMQMRKVSLTLPLPATASAEQMEAFLEKTRALLLANTGIVGDTVQVRFAEFVRGALQVSVVYFTNTTVYAEYLTIKDEMNLAILQILAECKLPLAGPEVLK
ncbi:MAG: mechanosensitive ion channel [Oscillospiraceae bacterium]|nr:mechanosensitive ion channel [Oscillospiraceae bacterium]